MKRQYKVYGALISVFVIVVVAVLILVGCDNGSTSTIVSSPSGVQNTPTGSVTNISPVSGPPNTSGDTWTINGVTVTIVADDWGPGGCHTTGGSRTFEIVNGSSTAIYSRLGAYTGTSTGCTSTSEKQVSPPLITGKTKLLPGEKGTVTYTVEKPQTCRLQVDDSWGPNEMNIFVTGDVFNSGGLCPLECVSKITETKEVKAGEWGACTKTSTTCAKTRSVTTVISDVDSCTGAKKEKSRSVKEESEPCECPLCTEPPVIDVLLSRGEWGECTKVGDTCLKSRYLKKTTVTRTCDGVVTKDISTTTETEPCECPCVDVVTKRGIFSIDELSNSGRGYVIKDDGTPWMTDLNLTAGIVIKVDHIPDGSNLCLWWSSEKIGCAKATCPAPFGALWHGKVSFSCIDQHSCPSY
jgi:hypothetical protein